MVLKPKVNRNRVKQPGTKEKGGKKKTSTKQRIKTWK